jgi:DNA modification methylase
VSLELRDYLFLETSFGALHNGHVLDVLPLFPSESVHCIVTSPPYWGLRDYGLPPQVWGGDPGCEHEWGHIERGRRKDILPADITTLSSRTGTDQRQNGAANNGGMFCRLCGALKCSYGLEPTPELYVEHTVQIFREARRVLRKDGTLWLNMGDCYAGKRNDRDNLEGWSRENARGGGHRVTQSRRRDDAPIPRSDYKVAGLKPKDLVMMPARVAMGLQSDGWFLRSQIPWLKRTAMPESCKDRPTTAVEYIFMFSRSGSCQFYVHREKGLANRIYARPDPDYRWKNSHGAETDAEPDGWRGSGLWRRINLWREYDYYYDYEAVKLLSSPGSKARAARARRNSDWFFESWQGLLLDEDGQPLACTVNPKGLEDAHYASFPPKMVEPLILAGCPEGGTVLDPFIGSVTTGLVAERLGRKWIGIELSLPYCSDIAAKRLAQGRLVL